MAIPTNVETLLKGNIVESARLEFKRNWNPEPILHSICAFANDIDNWGGGYILIGIEENNGKPKLPISGFKIEEIDNIQKELLNKCKLIQPEYVPIVEPVMYQNKHILDDMTENIFKGPLDYMIKSALRFLQNYLIEERIIKVPYQAEAIRYFNYPYPALEEALVNAMYHRRIRC